MNGPTRKKLYNIMAKDEGEFCKLCNVSGDEKQLVIDHKDNNNSNNTRDNLQLLCRSCNYKKNPRRPVDMCESESPSEIKINRTFEPMFRKYVASEINERTSVSEDELKNAGAEHIGISPTTAKRYLDKMCSVFGLYERTKGRLGTFIQYKDELPFS